MNDRLETILETPAPADAAPLAPPVAPLATPHHLAYIDAARGWAFLGVLTFHAFARAPVKNYFLQSLAASGNYGVQLFFIASALTLFMSLESRRTRDDRPITYFFIRRFFRIAPLFYVGIVFYLLAWGTGPRDFAPTGIHPHQIILTALFLHGWWPDAINSVVPGGWSIAVEMNFYLLLPLLFLGLTTLRRAVMAFVISVPITITISIAVARLARGSVDPTLVSGFTYYWLPRQFSVFLLGIIVFHLSRKPGNHALATLVAILGLLGLIVVSLIGDRIPDAYLAHSICFAVILVALRSAPLRLLVNPATRLLGTISFSAYICHFFALDLAVATLPKLSFLPANHSLIIFAVLWLLGLVLTCAFSCLTYRLIEIPGQNLGRAIIAVLSKPRNNSQPFSRD
jgi:peptidoglycan/LPS O-acetylase OafA/YrhL